MRVWGPESAIVLTPRYIFWGPFFYVLTMALLLQKVILPSTPWHAGHGLLAGGDWVFFHSAADQLALSIEKHGWARWELRPEGQAPIGIAAALYAVTGIHEPWVILPINAALLGVGAVWLWSSVEACTGNRFVALIALAPLVLFPSSAMIWGQLHKDVWILAGVSGLSWCLILLGCDERCEPATFGSNGRQFR